MNELYIINNKPYTAEQVIQNALDQEAEGITPHYAWYNYKKKEPIHNPGWLVWSTMKDGVGVVYRRNDGRMVITTGVQGDFCYC